MFPWFSLSTCSAASPCTRLSRAPSTINGSDFHNGFCVPMDSPFSPHTRPIVSTVQDRRGSPRFRIASLSARAVLSDPAGVSSPLASYGSLLLPSKYSTLSASGSSCHEAQSLHLRYGLDVDLPTLSPCRYLHKPKARFLVGWLSPLPGRESHPLEAPGLPWRTKVSLQVCVIHRLIPGFNMPAYLLQRLMRRAARPEPIRAILEISFKDRLQN